MGSYESNVPDLGTGTYASGDRLPTYVPSALPRPGQEVSTLDTKTRPGPSSGAGSTVWPEAPGEVMAQPDETAVRLNEMLLRTAGNEISRRRTALPMGDLDADDLAQQVAKSALAAITANLGDHDGRTAFTIWASKYVVAEISAEIARLAWRTVSIPADQEHWARLPALAGLSADEQASWTRAVAALRRAVTEDLSEQQRAAFQAVVLGNIPIDVLAMELRSTRNAVYKALFEARRKLRNSLAADGLGLEPVTQQLLGEPPGLDRLLGVTQGDAGCDVTFQNLDGYVDAERRGLDPARNYAPVEAHLRSCDPCRQDYRGVLAASRGAVRAPAGWPS